MSQREGNVLTRAIAYRHARIAHIAARASGDKVVTKAAEATMNQAHSDLLLATELYERQMVKAPER